MKKIIRTKFPVFILMAFLGGCFVLFPQQARAEDSGLIFISKAFQLDANKNVVADIYPQVQKQDNVWATVPNASYVRLTFQSQVDKTKNIDIYAKPTDQNQPATIEVYPVYTDADGNQTEGSLVAIFPTIDHQGTYRAPLTNIGSTTDVFDLKIIGSVDIDYIVDPGSVALVISTAATTCTGSPNWTTNAVTCNVNVTDIQTLINAGTSVSFTATGGANITVSNAISKTAGGDVTISMYSGSASKVGNIFINAAISSTVGKLGMLLNADRGAYGNGFIDITAALTSNGGDITMGGGSGTITADSGFAMGNNLQASQVQGVLINNVAVAASGGNIIVNGEGANITTNGNPGVRVTGASGAITTTGSGTININGIGAGTSNNGSDYGVEVDTGGVISTQNGNLTVIGTGGGAGTGTNNYGVYVTGTGSSTIETTGSGNLSITGIRGGGDTGTNYGVNVAIANGLYTTSTGNITVAADTILLAQANDINSIRNLTIGPYTPSNTVGVGTGSGTLGLTNTFLGYLTWGAINTLTIGSTTAGAIAINSTSTTLQNNNVTFLASSTSAITLTSMLANTTAGTTTIQGGTGTINSANAFYNLTINTSGNTTTLGHALNVTGNLNITAGTLDTSSGNNYAVNVGGNWSNAGTFTAQSGTVTLNGTSQTITGTTTFNNLTKNVTTAATLTFPASAKQTITGTLNLSGAAGQLLSLVSSNPATQWQIDPQGTRTISYLSVTDSNNTNSTLIATAGLNITNGGDNTNWSFGGGSSAPTVTTQTPSPISDTSATLNGNIMATGGANPTVRGFAYGTASDLSTVIATTTESGSFGTGAFTDFVFGLSCNTTYYSRAYATNSGGTGFGTTTSFNTSSCSSSPPTIRFLNGFIRFLNGSIKIR